MQQDDKVDIIPRTILTGKSPDSWKPRHEDVKSATRPCSLGINRAELEECFVWDIFTFSYFRKQARVRLGAGDGILGRNGGEQTRFDAKSANIDLPESSSPPKCATAARTSHLQTRPIGSRTRFQSTENSLPSTSSFYNTNNNNNNNKSDGAPAPVKLFTRWVC